MADGDVKYRFLGDSQSVERAMAQMEKRYDSLEGKIRSVSRASKKSNSDGIDGFRQMTDFATNAIAKFGSVAAAATVIGSAIGRMSAEIEQAARAERDFGKLFLQNAAMTGRLAQAPGARAFAENLPGITSEQALASLGGVQSGAPFMDPSRQQALAAHIAQLSPLLAPAEVGKVPDTSKLGTFAGFAAELGDAFPGKSAGDVTDLAWAAFQKSGSKFAQLDSSAFERALGPLSEKFGPEGALARIVTGFDSGIDSRRVLTEGALDKLDPALIRQNMDAFVGAQQGDIVQRDLRLAGAADPTTMLGQMAAASHQKRIRGFAQGESFQDAIEELNHIPGIRGVPQTIIEGFAEGARKIAGPGADPMGAGEQAWLKDLLEKQLAAQQRTIQLLEQQRPPIRRDAQSE